MPGPTLDVLLREAVATLARAGVDSPAADAEILAAHVLRIDRRDVARDRILGRPVAPGAAARFGDLVAERAARLPLQHLTGRAHLRTVTVDVGPGVFVPRPESEVTAQLAVQAVTALGGERPVRVVDLCAGSGVLGLAVAAEASTAGIDVRVVGLELSPHALAWARRNADEIGGGRVEIRPGAVADAAQVLADLLARTDVVVANPPYIPLGEEPKDPEARDHDPAMALFGGADGLDVVRDVAAAAALLLRPGGTVVVEHGMAQGEAVRAILVAAGMAVPVTHEDLTGRPRVSLAHRPG